MRILNIIQCANLGGMERASLRLMVELQQRGHSCELLSLNPLGALKPLLSQAGIPAKGLPYSGPGGVFSAPALRRTLKECSADALIMTGHNLLAMIAVGNICRRTRILAIHFPHTGVKPTWQWRLIYTIACFQFKAITFVSNYIRSEAETIYPPIGAKSHTVRNPLPLPSLPTAEERRTIRQALGFSASTRIIGNAGRLVESKRFDVFLMVAHRVLSSRKDTCFVIAGDGPDRARLESISKELNIEGDVRWLGWKENLAEFYSVIDVLLFNTDEDAFPNTPLEAMSYGVPVVASARNSGLREVFSEPHYGYLIQEHDIDSLATAVLSFLDKAGGSLPETARARVASLCGAKPIVDRIEDLLVDV